MSKSCVEMANRIPQNGRFQIKSVCNLGDYIQYKGKRFSVYIDIYWTHKLIIKPRPQQRELAVLFVTKLLDVPIGNFIFAEYIS